VVEKGDNKGIMVKSNRIQGLSTTKDKMKITIARSDLLLLVDGVDVFLTLELFLDLQQFLVDRDW